MPATLAPTDLFTTLIEGLYTCVSNSVRYGSADIPLAILLWRRLRRLARRFAAILAHLRAGTLPLPGAARRHPAPARPASPRPASPSPASPRPASPRPAAELPTHLGWVTHEISMAVFQRYPLEDLLGHPQTETLVAAAPQLGRVLRPLCRMLAIRPPAWLRLPRRPRRIEEIPPAPDWLLSEPGAELRSDGSVWMRLGVSTNWRPGSGQTLEQARKFDPPIRVWPRQE